MGTEYILTANGELFHYGVKGMKWGVRRYQNSNGSLTSAGKKRYNDGGNKSDNKRIAKKVAAAVIMTATVTAAAALYAKNPYAVNRVVSKVGNATISGLKSGGSKAVTAGKKYMNSAFKLAKDGVKSAPAKAKNYAKTAAKLAKEGIKEGVKESIKEAPKKATKAIITGATMMAAKRLLDSQVGKEEAARIFQANNNKKISSFWKVSNEDRDDDE